VPDPSLYESAGGGPGIRALTDAFYVRAFADPLLRPLFHDPDAPHHAERLAWWFTELLGGPPVHTEQRGGLEVMRSSHTGLGISEEARARWVELMVAATHDVGLDDRFRERFQHYLEMGSNLAMRASERRERP